MPSSRAICGSTLRRSGARSASSTPKAGGVPGSWSASAKPPWPAGLTDSEGRLSLQTLGEEALRMRLTSADGRWAVANLPGGNGGVPCSSPMRHRRPDRCRRDATGQPLAGALVWTGADPGAFSLTNAEGSYRIPVPQGSSFWVEARAGAPLAPGDVAGPENEQRASADSPSAPARRNRGKGDRRERGADRRCLGQRRTASAAGHRGPAPAGAAGRGLGRR